MKTSSPSSKDVSSDCNGNEDEIRVRSDGTAGDTNTTGDGMNNNGSVPEAEDDESEIRSNAGIQEEEGKLDQNEVKSSSVSPNDGENNDDFGDQLIQQLQNRASLLDDDYNNNQNSNDSEELKIIASVDSVDAAEKVDKLGPMQFKNKVRVLGGPMQFDDSSDEELDSIERGAGRRSYPRRRRRRPFQKTPSKSSQVNQDPNNIDRISNEVAGGATKRTKANVHLRSERSFKPVPANQRLRGKLLNLLKPSKWSKEVIDGDDVDDNEPQHRLSINQNFWVSTSEVDCIDKGGIFMSSHGIEDSDNEDNTGSIHAYRKQYRLQSAKSSASPLQRGEKFRRLLNWLGKIVTTRDEWVKSYLRWAFRNTFPAVFLSAAIAFFGLTMLFSVFIWGIAKTQPTCIGGVDPERQYFADAYMLSWTTFTTVGYGTISSGISTDEHNVIEKCTFITILVTLEAFTGIIFASFCGAICYAKISRIQSFAHVTFSDPMVIRYGHGVDFEHNVDELYDFSNSLKTGSAFFAGETESFPCPVLEFQIINRRNRLARGEIIDANLQVIAAIDVEQGVSSQTIAKRRSGNRKMRNRQRSSKRDSRTQRSIGRSSSGKAKRRLSESPERKRLLSILNESHQESLMSSAIPSRTKDSNNITHHDFDHLVARKIFSKLEIETPEHPFFKRTWMARHVLDEYSPLLKQHAKMLVKRNGGLWPKELSSYTGVRSAIRFDQILVSLSGTSNADANSVYASKVYEFADLNVGYAFANILYRDVNGELRVDKQLVNDVVEQAGGGGEPLTDAKGEQINEMLVL